MTASNVYTIIFTLTTLVKVSFCSLVVPTLQGLVVGKYNDGAKVFLGIPFAEPPVGPLRWRSPVQKRPWGIHFATNYGPKCPQTPCNTDYSFGRPCSNVMSEDCLQLNIYVPIRTKPFHKLATLVFIHGGFFHLGSAVSPLFHGEKFVRKSDVILVTLNYRIGALGSLWTADGPGGIKGNFGIQDQRLAVKWVYNNIRNFGGDPDRISIFGRSAGASYVAIHLVNRMLDRYIKGAIIMSAPFGIGTKSAEQAISVGRSFSQNLNCDPYDPPCLRSKTTEEIINAQRSADLSSLSLLKRFVPWAPFFDSEFPIDLLPAFREGLIGVRNVIIGVTKEEDARYTYDFFPDPISIEAYRENIIPGLLPDQASEMLERYVPLDPDDTRPTVRQVFDDVVFTCPSRRAALDLSRNGLRSVWFYVFDNVLRFLQGTDILLECQQYSCHGNENALLFQTIEKFDYRFTPADQRLADELTAAWTNFAKYGSPIWPRYNRVLRLYKLFKVLGSPVLSDFRGRACSQFDQDGFNA